MAQAPPGLSVRDYAFRVGVSDRSVRSALSTCLKPAVIDWYGKIRIDADHPNAREYEGRDRASYRSHPTRQDPTEAPQSAPAPMSTPTPSEDPFALAASMVEPVSAEFEKRLRGYVEGYLFDMSRQLPGNVPPDVDEIGNMTLRECVERFGSTEQMKQVIDGMRKWAIMQREQLSVKERRGELIERQAVATTIFPVLSVIMRRAVEEAPQSAALHVTQLALAGGEGVELRIEDAIRREISAVFKGAKENLERAFTHAGGGESQTEPLNPESGPDVRAINS